MPAPIPSLIDPVRKFPGLAVRCGALPFRRTSEGLEYLLIRRPGASSWSIPKGQPIEGVAYRDTARIEAIEEAGAIGTIRAEPAGSYRHRRARHGFFTSDEVVEVLVFPLEVERVDRGWPEHGARLRRWFSAVDLQGVASAPLAELISAFEAAETAQSQTVQPAT